MVILVSSLLSWFLSNTLALCPSFDVLISNLQTKHPYLGVHMPYGVNVTWNSSICSSGIALRPSFDVSIPNLQPEPPYLGFTCYNVTWNSSISSSGNQQLCSHALITFSQWWHVSFLIDYIYAFFFWIMELVYIYNRYETELVGILIINVTRKTLPIQKITRGLYKGALVSFLTGSGFGKKTYPVSWTSPPLVTCLTIFQNHLGIDYLKSIIGSIMYESCISVNRLPSKLIFCKRLFAGNLFDYFQNHLKFWE